jgi:hypothetical protein
MTSDDTHAVAIFPLSEIPDEATLQSWWRSVGPGVSDLIIKALLTDPWVSLAS